MIERVLCDSSIQRGPLLAAAKPDSSERLQATSELDDHVPTVIFNNIIINDAIMYYVIIIIL